VWRGWELEEDERRLGIGGGGELSGYEGVGCRGGGGDCGVGG
jgi:hypothetical protein